METSVFNFHDDTGDILGNYDLTAGDDATQVKWADVNKDITLYASHWKFVHKVAEEKKSHW